MYIVFYVSTMHFLRFWFLLSTSKINGSHSLVPRSCSCGFQVQTADVQFGTSTSMISVRKNLVFRRLIMFTFRRKMAIWAVNVPVIDLFNCASVFVCRRFGLTMPLNDLEKPELVPISNVIGMSSQEPLATFLGSFKNCVVCFDYFGSKWFIFLFLEMWYQTFLWALFSSTVVHAAAAVIAFGTLHKHNFGKWVV